jgi:hypothetical protein
VQAPAQAPVASPQSKIGIIEYDEPEDEQEHETESESESESESEDDEIY